jgi:hypothetical protein
MGRRRGGRNIASFALGGTDAPATYKSLNDDDETDQRLTEKNKKRLNGLENDRAVLKQTNSNW